jgi:hypothetical protein
MDIVMPALKLMRLLPPFFFTLLHAEAASKPSVTKLKKASDQL